MKLIIAGSRKITDYQDVLDGVIASGFWREYKRTIEVVSGKAPGVDTLGELFADRNGLIVHPFPADWDDISVQGAVIKYTASGKAYNVLAGHWRNWEMGRFADKLLAIHDGRSTGTQSMINFMKSLKKEVYVHIPERFKSRRKK